MRTLRGSVRQHNPGSLVSLVIFVGVNSFLMIVLSWNIRGLGVVGKRKVMRGLVDRIKPMVLFIQETKLSSYDHKIFSSLGGSLLQKGVGVDAIRASDGLITLWNEDKFVVSNCISRERLIFVIGQMTELKKVVGFCNVYADTVESNRKTLWNDIVVILNSFPIPWVVGGDFNAVLDPSERIGASVNMGSIRNFNSFVLRAKVIYIPLQGMAYTWSNFRDSATWSRLDRFLISPMLMSWLHLLR
ncbi:hypothetical protein Dsin_013221 [Dipteronia sinensis]|uniref:Endonuclease/exonuclease/phosphatase domain-containing protein n=1 Tax=Dipteronia sinensis TaxID=43782 RepID=A0AAE0AJI4_9ROSI|nr:hypothetical protein Dsin_013221 [Dipteronia sinensis]